MSETTTTTTVEGGQVGVAGARYVRIENLTLYGGARPAPAQSPQPASLRPARIRG